MVSVTVAASTVGWYLGVSFLGDPSLVVALRGNQEESQPISCGERYPKRDATKMVGFLLALP